MKKQSKTNKQQFKTKKNPSLLNKLAEKTNSPDFFYPLGCLLIVFLIYSFSLFRQWLPFDERLIYKETFFPIPTKFNEISEIINSFVLKSHILSINTFFSNLANLRSNPITFGLIVFISYFFKKHAFLYHLLQLTFHLVNVGLVFILFKKVISNLSTKESENNITLLVASLFTLLWGLHSTNTEAILLTSNLTAVLTYTFCFGFLLYEITKFEKNFFSRNTTQTILISFTFLILMFLTEYGYSVPLIIFAIAFAYRVKGSGSIKDSTLSAFNVSKPYFLGLFLFLVFSLLNQDSTISNIINSSKTSPQASSSFIYSFFERALWLSPQLFIHFLKLLVFPRTLSLYQSNLVHLSSSLFSAYSIICLTLSLILLVTPLILFFLFKKKSHSFIYPLIYAFYFAAFPFLHIITPTYCLSADRYLYFPSFVFLFVLVHFFHILTNQEDKNFTKKLLIPMSIIVFIFGVRTLVRINEWNDPFRLYNSAVKTESNSLYKGQRMIILADYVGEKGDLPKMEKLLQDSLSLLNKSLSNYKKKSRENKNEPITLKLYGLDNKSLLLKSAYSIATIKNDNYREDPKILLEFLDPYFQNNIKKLGINQIVLYSEILQKANLTDRLKEVLEFGYKRFNYSDEIANKLATYYMFYEKAPDKAFRVLQYAYNIFPNNVQIMENLLKYYEQKNDLLNEAKIAYLLGLRLHSIKHYQLAVKIYLDLNQIQLANMALKKAIRLQEDEPLTLLLASRYLDLTGKRGKILEVLNSALIASNKLGNKQNVNVTKSILVSLINVHANSGNLDHAKQFLKVFESIKDLTPADIAQIKATKKLIADIESKQNIKSVSRQ